MIGIIFRFVPPVALTIAMPAHDEERALPGVLDGLRDTVVAHLDGVQIVVVDDASTDGTAALLRERAAVDGVEVVTRTDRGGQGPALLSALERARASWLFLLDSDDQFSAADFWTLWERRDDADLVLGVRTPRRDPLHRRALSRTARVPVAALAGRRLQDPATPFRLVRRQLLDDVLPLLPPAPLTLSTLVAVAAARRGWRVAEVPVAHRQRAGTASRLRSWRLGTFVVRGSVELARVAPRLRGGS